MGFLKTQRSVSGLCNLPLHLTPFVGRHKERAELAGRLADPVRRLLTLVGPGGIGKTRLGLQVAAELLPQYPDGVWLVQLADLSDPALVPQAAASALGIREQPDRPLLETLASHLESMHLLLVLDNCEHLVTACAQLAHRLLAACPNLRILATSREPLHIVGEVRWLVPSLSLPDAENLPSVKDLVGYEAIRLFVDRTEAAVPSFAVTSDNPQGPDSGERRVTRGGSFDMSESRLRTAFRIGNLPAYSNWDVGFRVVVPADSSIP